MHKLVAPVIVVATLVLSSTLARAEVLKIYGPGGPAPAVKELAAAFAKERGVEVIVTAGPASEWLEQAKRDADLIFSGSENMMSGFVASFEGRIDESSIEPLYLRPSTILVRKGNPRRIKGLRDLARPGMKVLVTEGAGQIGMWEDAVGRSGKIALLKRFRENIVAFAANSGLARKRWIDQPEIDAWLIWNHWQINNATIADMIPVERELTIWRPMDIAMTSRGKDASAAAAFVEYLKSAKAKAVFKRQGWKR